MKIINFVNPNNTMDGYKLLVHCVFSGLDYDNTKFYMNREGFYLPEDQFNAFKSCCDIMMDLDIGDRKKEVSLVQGG